MPVAEEPQARTRSREETLERKSTDYVKFSPFYRTVVRLLQDNARTVWKHYVPQANKGGGLSAVCPNIVPGLNACPIEQKYSDLPKDDPERRANNARKRFIINVLDRTPHTTCPHCSALTPGKTGADRKGKFCINCDGDLKGTDFAPLNKLKILEQGPKLFYQFNTIEKLQLEEIEKPISGYDITITSEGVGRDRVLTAMPGADKELEKDAMLDDEGNEQTLYDLELLAEPTASEAILLMLQGASIDQIRAVIEQ